MSNKVCLWICMLFLVPMHYLLHNMHKTYVFMPYTVTHFLLPDSWRVSELKLNCFDLNHTKQMHFWGQKDFVYNLVCIFYFSKRSIVHIQFIYARRGIAVVWCEYDDAHMLSVYAMPASTDVWIHSADHGGIPDLQEVQILKGIQSCNMHSMICCQTVPWKREGCVCACTLPPSSTVFYRVE